MFPIPCNSLLSALLDVAALGAGRVKQHFWDLLTARAMPQDTGLPDSSKSRPATGQLSLPPKKWELMEREVLPAEGSPEQPGSGSAMPATLCQPCLPRRQQAAARVLPRAACLLSSWAKPVAPVGIRQPQVRSTLPGHMRDADGMVGTADGAALGCGQSPGTAAACRMGWHTSDPEGSPQNYHRDRSCLHTVTWTSLSRQHTGRQARGLGTVVALPGHWSPASPVAPAGAKPGGGHTEPDGGLPLATPLPTACIMQAQVYYGLPAPNLAVATNELGREGASLQDAGTAPATLPVPCLAARFPPLPSPSEPPSPTPQPSGGTAPLQPRPRAASLHEKGEEKPPVNTRDVPTVPTPVPTHFSASIMLSPMGPSYALVYSLPLCPTVTYWQHQARPVLVGSGPCCCQQQAWPSRCPISSGAP